MTTTYHNYPNFQANQVLTAEQLNELFHYLDEQNRLTRSQLIGIGIVCGLELTNPDKKTIVLSRGVGVTSEGYLILLEESELTHYQKYDPDEKPRYEPFYKAEDSNDHYELNELLPSSEAALEGVSVLTEEFLKEKAVLLFLEHELIDLKDCVVTSCIEKGQELRFRVVKLLIDKLDLIKIIKNLEGLVGDHTEEDLESQFLTKTNLPTLYLNRYDVINSDPKTAAEVLEKYTELFPKEKVTELSDAINQFYAVFKPIINLPLHINILEALENQLSSKRDNPDLTVQYLYDWLFNLVEAYHELRDAAFCLLSECSPDSDHFPRHLMLGEALSDNRTVPTPFRNYFIYSPLFGRGKENLEKVRQLFSRLIHMIKYTDFSLITEPKLDDEIERIKITPSNYGRLDISKKAIPFYYDKNYPFFKLWDFAKTKRGRSAQNLSYHSEEYASWPAVLKPLEFDLEAYNFFRIAGHVAMPISWAVREINQQILQYRLPFKVVALGTGDEFYCRLSDFLKKHPGIDHRGGVPRGGTFILVYQGEEGQAEPEEPPVPPPSEEEPQIQFFNNVPNMKKWDRPLTMYLGNDPIVEGITYQMATPFIAVPEGNHKIVIKARVDENEDIETTIIEKDITIRNGQQYFALVSGIIHPENPDIEAIPNKGLDIYFNKSARTNNLSDDSVDISIFNGILDLNEKVLIVGDGRKLKSLKFPEVIDYISFSKGFHEFTTVRRNSAGENIDERIFVEDFTSFEDPVIIVCSGLWAPEKYIGSDNIRLEELKLKHVAILPSGKTIIMERSIGRNNPERIDSSVERKEANIRSPKYSMIFNDLAASFEKSDLRQNEIERLLQLNKEALLHFATQASAIWEAAPLYKHGTVIADFYLPYLCCSEDACILPCKGEVQSAKYKWFISGDLLRDPVISREGYSITLNDYTLNGEQLNLKPYILRFSPNELRHGLKAIMDRLNEIFPRGLVFEAKEPNSSEFYIHRFNCHQFHIEMTYGPGQSPFYINEEHTRWHTDDGVLKIYSAKGERIINYCEEEGIEPIFEAPYSWLRKKLGYGIS